MGGLSSPATCIDKKIIQFSLKQDHPAREYFSSGSGLKNQILFDLRILILSVGYIWRVAMVVEIQGSRLARAMAVLEHLRLRLWMCYFAPWIGEHSFSCLH